PPATDSPSRIAGNERAELHFELAEAHFAAERYEDALVELQTVRDVTGSDEVLYNMGRCYEAMGRPAAAMRQYERFLAADIQGSLHEDATVRLANLREQVASAEDDEADGPGVGTYIGLALGGAGLAVGAVFGLMTLVEDGNLMGGCGATGTCSGEELSDIRAYRTVADIAFMTAAIAGTAGVIALILWANEGDGDDGVEGADTVRVTPYVVPGEGAGASASVRF
ncbi:MAG: bacterial transcriptional activator domain-containing protein, partial [Deltaproteobacteria bacterium]|nr:bacterial transcriptional activator domain-containing protein [Deltaproteobacteria bacterium]